MSKLYVGLALLVAGLVAVQAAPNQGVYVPVVQGLQARSGNAYPPNGLSCILQTGAAVAFDPVKNDYIFACEAKNNHGAIAWEGSTLLVDSIEGSPTRMAAGSVSLSGPADPNGIIMVSVRTDGGIAWRYIP